ncbi:hypothetical protein CSOJ01_00766 [Colletotrichum sojae]|uniref:Uncharacterized protein n=1 Tax=Colletotrichum sojae TaxID=2175907 RepID=A0A8H6JWM4_9PEZI|nr:hypothetical protein CSOJ01_00766 [Colletotrichum sojae]
MAGIVDVGVTDMSVAACPVDVVSVGGDVDDERVRLPCEREVERRGVPILVGINGEVDGELNGLVLLLPIGACRELLGVIPTGEPMVVDADVDVPFCPPGIKVGVVGVMWWYSPILGYKTRPSMTAARGNLFHARASRGHENMAASQDCLVDHELAQDPMQTSSFPATKAEATPSRNEDSSLLALRKQLLYAQ